MSFVTKIVSQFGGLVGGYTKHHHVHLKCSRFTLILPFIISLSLSVGQVKSVNEHNKEMHKRSLKTMQSAAEGISNNRTELSHFQFNKLGWQTFDNWESNRPQVIQYGSVPYGIMLGRQKQTHLLLSGGKKHSILSTNTPSYGSWLYTLQTNSWQRVDIDQWPPLAGNPVMVQICSKIIVLELLNANNISNSCNAWMFDTISHKWQQTQVYGLFPSWLPFITGKKTCPRVTGVSVQDSQTTCKCNRSAFIMFDDVKVKGYERFGEVRCVNQNGSESYEWINVKFNIPQKSNFKFKLAAAYSNGIVVYVPTQTMLWKFENRTWTNVSKIPYHLQLFRHSSPFLGCTLVTQNNSYIVFNIRGHTAINFNLTSNDFVIENVENTASDDTSIVVTAIPETPWTIIVFLGDIYVAKTSVWKFIYKNGVWVWKRMPDPDRFPIFKIIPAYSLIDNYLIVFGIFRDLSLPVDKRLSSGWIGSVWKLDLASMQWWLEEKGVFLYFSTCKAGCWIGSCCYVAFCHLNGIHKELWIYNTSDNNSWRLLLTTSLTRHLSEMSFVAANKTTAVMFGGRSRVLGFSSTFHDTWILHFNPDLQWRQVSGDTLYSAKPSARYGHAAVMMQSKMYVFGGINDSMNCLNDLWVFDVDIETWSEVTTVNEKPDISNLWPCAYSAASSPGQLLVTVTCDSSHELSKSNCQDSPYKTWMFIIHYRMWHLIASAVLKENSLQWGSRFLLKSTYWNGILVMFNSIKVNIKYIVVRCPAGLSSSNISERPCKYCRKGYYRETMFSDPDCVPCPNGLTTVSVGAREITECSVCDVNRCKYGKCVPDLGENSERSICLCYFGFTGSTCQYPTYFLIGAGLILFAAVVSAGVTAYVLMVKRKKVKERALRKQVDALTDVWQIDEDEVTSEGRIGSGASGAVYKACYRNLVVAVKKMIAVGLPKSTEDFETEIVFMRTVRHKNIVLFIGAGKSQLEDVPFLVMEYMERGSLKNVLYDLSIEIDYDRKLSFAMDSARGMHFLHTLEPPRIHRDLKSDNLLVSKDWIVKVADFGLGRAITNDLRINEKQQRVLTNISCEHDVPLLPLCEDLSFSGVGTARWRAPELILREPYDTAVDVYSYAIVLWEIWTRQLPFAQHSFDYEVTDAVIRGERPIIPQDCPQSISIIINNCWSNHSSDRLTFGQIISHLQSLPIACLHALVNDVCM